MQGYAAALALAPDNEVLAAEALSEALSSGDRALAVTAARVLERAGRLAPDARLLLLTEAVRTRRWAEAGAQADRIEENEIFSFMTPVLRAWLAHGSGKGDPLDILQPAADHALSGVYVAEHRPLLLLARGERKQGAAELLAATQAPGVHGQRMRIAAAALLARKGDKRAALALLEGEGAALAMARGRVESGKRLRGEVVTAPAGIGEFLIRIAVDLHGQEVPDLALSFARLATFIAPDNSEAWLVVAELLGIGEQHEAALAALANIPADDPLASDAGDSRITLLSAAGRADEALNAAKSSVAGTGAGVEDWARLGGLHSEMKRPAEAAEAYGRALALYRERPAQGHPEWALWVLHGSALIEAGDWPRAKAALESAYKLAPDQAVVLNYLGYSQLERRENLVEAERLIREASRLEPDDAAITDSLGWALYLRGKIPEAVAVLERAAQGQPTDPAINEHLGDAYYGSGRRFEARYAWKAALLQADAETQARLRAKIEAGLTPELAAP